MKIVGDNNSNPCNTHVKESVFCLGTRDYLKGPNWVRQRISDQFFWGHSVEVKTVENKIHLHISKDTFSSITGKLREYLLPWRWKSAFLDAEDGSQPQRILVCTSQLSSTRLDGVVGKLRFITYLIAKKCYSEIFGKEFLYAPGADGPSEVIHSLGKWYGYSHSDGHSKMCHFFRKRSLYSTLKYHLLKQYSTTWKEATLQIAGISEKVLIKKTDELPLSKLTAARITV